MSMCLGLLASGWGFLELFSSKFLCVWKKGFDSWELGEIFWRVKWVWVEFMMGLGKLLMHFYEYGWGLKFIFKLCRV